MAEIGRPGPGEELAGGEPSVPRQAASVIVLRGGPQRLELLLVQRNPNARFMGGVWVFPGGAVDALEGTGDESHRAAAVRELSEEAGIYGVESDALVKFSQWITPALVKIRFDTHFYLAVMPDEQTARVDGSECIDHGWFTPGGALQAHERGEIALVFPTIKHLEQLEAFGSATELLDYARGRDVIPVEPRVVLSGEVARVVLPGEAGY